MAWYPATRYRRPDKQGTFQSLLTFIRPSSASDIQHGGRDSEVQPSQVWDQQREAAQPNPPGCHFSHNWQRTEVKISTSKPATITRSGSCPTCSLGTDTSATMGLFLRPGRAHITRLKDRVNWTNWKPTLMDGKDRRQGSSWCLWDWHRPKTYWHSHACQV